MVSIQQVIFGKFILFIFFYFTIKRDLRVSFIFLIGLLGLVITWIFKYLLGTFCYYFKNKKFILLFLVLYYLGAIGIASWRGHDSTFLFLIRILLLEM